MIRQRLIEKVDILSTIALKKCAQRAGIDGDQALSFSSCHVLEN